MSFSALALIQLIFSRSSTVILATSSVRVVKTVEVVSSTRI